MYRMPPAPAHRVPLLVCVGDVVYTVGGYKQGPQERESPYTYKIASSKVKSPQCVRVLFALVASPHVCVRF